MSLSRIVPITCPTCQKESDFLVWESINTMLDPDMKASVRDRSAFLFTCPHCGRKSHVDYGFLYHQMEDNIMIHYATSDENAETISEFMSANNAPDMLKEVLESGYLNRIVRSQNALLEKLAIFDAGLDDRIIEIFKIIVLLKFLDGQSEQYEEIELFYFNDNGEHFIQIIADGKPKGAAPLSMEIYEGFREEFSSRLPEMREDGPFIDRQWALEFMGIGDVQEGNE